LKAVRLDPGKADLWNNLGHFYHVEERTSDAIIAYRKALQLDPQSSSAKFALEACYRRLGKNASVEEHKQLIHK
jgi:cytochrome c-type biogenesis protein CcmH/NrfG